MSNNQAWPLLRSKQERALKDSDTLSTKLLESETDFSTLEGLQLLSRNRATMRPRLTDPIEAFKTGRHLCIEPVADKARHY